MAYGFKSKYVRKYARKGRSSVAKLAKGKTSSVQALAKAVKSMQRRMKRNVEFLNYSYGQAASSVSYDVTYFNLTKYSDWSTVFGASSNDDDQNTMIHKSFGLDCYLTANDEPDSTQFTVFLVSLKDAIGTGYSASSGNLSLSANVHYVQRGGMVFLNKKIFNIHKQKRIVLTNHGTSLANPSAQTQSGTDRRWYWKMRLNKKVVNPYGDWKELAAPNDPSNAYFLMIFNDNSTLDSQSPTIQFQAVHTIQTVA